MCRLLGVVSSSPAQLPMLLGEDLHHYSALSAVHADGWGHASWSGEGLVLHKEPAQAAASERYTSSLAGVTTDAAVLHLRRASAGMVNQEHNTHPFVAGELAFAHNGYATPNSALDALLAAAGAEPCAGSTDSERYFALVRALLPGRTPAQALAQAAQRIVAVAGEVEALNALLLTPEAMFAYCWYDDAVAAKGGKKPGDYELHWAVDGDAAIVASTGWDRTDGRWSLVPFGAVLEVPRGGGAVRIHPAETLTELPDVA